MSKQTKPISKAFAYGYGLGEMGFTFFNFLVAYYLMYYLTDVLCLPMVLAASLYSGIQWVEVATMLAAGVLIDKSRLRSGKYRPWIVGGSILCAINLVLFYTDFSLSKTLAAILFTLTYFLCYCGYNTMWVAYRALLGPLCHSPKDSVVITTSASQLSSVAGLIFIALGKGNRAGGDHGGEAVVQGNNTHRIQHALQPIKGHDEGHLRPDGLDAGAVLQLQYHQIEGDGERHPRHGRHRCGHHEAAQGQLPPAQQRKDQQKAAAGQKVRRQAIQVRAENKEGEHLLHQQSRQAAEARQNHGSQQQWNLAQIHFQKWRRRNKGKASKLGQEDGKRTELGNENHAKGFAFPNFFEKAHSQSATSLSE